MDITVFLLLVIGFIGYVYLNRFYRELEELRQDLRRRDETQAKLEARLRELEAGSLRTAPVAAPAGPAPVMPPVAAPASTTAIPAPPAPVQPAPVAPRPVPPVAPPVPASRPVPVAAATAAPIATSPIATEPIAAPPVVASPPPAPPLPPVPAGPTWWDRAEKILLENWTGILGAVVLVTGVGFLGIYTALKLAPIYRFLLISGMAGALLGARVYLRRFAFAERLSVWLQSSAAAIFLFACVGAVSIPGLRWATPPLDYVLLLTGVAVNLYLAWTASREAVATLHGVLSLVALAVLPPAALPLAAATGVTVFSIIITYRERWKYQLLLSLVSFFCFHLYWHQTVAVLTPVLRLMAMGLVLVVGVAAALVQYRRIYANARFEPLLFVAHLLNWTFLGINLYLYSTGSRWKTVPLGLGAVATFFVARHARHLGIRWLFRTDTLISLALALATAFSLQGWQASASIVLLFVLLELLVVAVVMARENEPVVFQVAAVGLLLTAGGLLLLNTALASFYTHSELYRHAGVLLLAGGLLTAYFRWLRARPVGEETVSLSVWERELLNTTGIAGGLLAAGAAALLSYALHHWPQSPTLALTVASGGVGLALFGLAAWVRTSAAWLARTHIVLGQLVLLLTVLGLHRLGLSWAGVALVAYLEVLVAALVLGWRREFLLLRLHMYTLLLGALVLPIVVSNGQPHPGLPPLLRLELLLAAACATLLWQAVAGRQQFPAYDALPLGTTHTLRLLGVAVGWLLLTGYAAYFLPADTFHQELLSWSAALLLAGLLFLRRTVQLPGLWAGLYLALAGMTVLQWTTAVDLGEVNQDGLQGVRALHFLLPALLVAIAGLATSWRPTEGYYLRWPWLYLLGVQLLVLAKQLPGAGLEIHSHHHLIELLLWLLLAVVAFVTAQGLRYHGPSEEEVRRQGQPDRHLLHLGYGYLGLALGLHLGFLMNSSATAAGMPEHRLSALALLVVLAGVATLRAPAGLPRSRSWQVLHPWLPELTLGFWTLTLLQELRGPWYGLFFLLSAFGLTFGGRYLPERLRRVWAYGRLYYWLAAGATALATLRHLSPAEILTLDWWGVALVVAGLFGYAFLALLPGQREAPVLPPAAGWLRPLTHLPLLTLIAALLYPAFIALALLLIQSFDRSVLTVLLTLESFAIFGTSIALRRRDMRYVSLAGVLVCLVRLVFFDLSQRDTFTRALVFIFMGLLLLGMNGLYSRFKVRFEAPELPEPPAEAPTT